MEFLKTIDTQLFFLINHLPHTTLLDFLMQTLSGLGSGGLIFLLFGFLLIIREEEKDHWFLLPLFCVSGLSWFISSYILKFGFSRLRPGILTDAVIVGSIPPSYSFPSTHATVAFAFAVLLSWKEPRWRWIWFTLAFLISFSRIYLGYHYPIDVIGGGVLGLCIGLFVVGIYKRLLLGQKKKRRLLL